LREVLKHFSIDRLDFLLSSTICWYEIIVPGDLKLMDLYLHVILSHFPSFFDQHSFQLTSTEPLERLFVTVKRAKYSTNRHKDNFMMTIFTHFQSEDLRKISLLNGNPEKILEEWSVKTKKKIVDQFTLFRDNIKENIQDIEIQLPAINDHHPKAVSTRSFIESMLLNINYSKEQALFNEGKLILKIKDDVISYLEATKPAERKESLKKKMPIEIEEEK